MKAMYMKTDVEVNNVQAKFFEYNNEKAVKEK